MYNIDELNSMSDEALRAVAEQMGLKKFKTEEKMDLVYQILDKQAEVASRVKIKKINLRIK